MIDTTDFVALTDAESAAIAGGGGFLLVLLAHLVNNLDSLFDGVRDGYAAGSPK